MRGGRQGIRAYNDHPSKAIVKLSPTFLLNAELKKTPKFILLHYNKSKWAENQNVEKLNQLKPELSRGH